MDSKENIFMESVPFSKVKIDDFFWNGILKTHRVSTIRACFDQCEETGRISNFKKAAGCLEGKIEGKIYNDSDVYKVLEGAAYTLADNDLPELEEYADEIISYIKSAQCNDGYLNTYFTHENPDEKWNDMDNHELYCMGHMIEAAVAYNQATGKDNFLEIAIKTADYLYNYFYVGKKHWVPGHEEIELALIRLYKLMRDPRYLELAIYFLDQRGHGFGRGRIWGKKEWGPEYCQDDVEVTNIQRVKGHAVRAMYLYAGMADVASINNNAGYIRSLNNVWEHLIGKNMYITGGIGASKENEGFTEDYDLPNKNAYCETCASVGMVLWNHRMNLLHKDGKYVDVLEKALYNGVLSGVSLSGDKFFYANPLSSDGNHHRKSWYGTSCCPTQIARFIPSIGGYIYAVTQESLFINLYMSNSCTIDLSGKTMSINVETLYPWDSRVKIILSSVDIGKFKMNLRIPGWCKSFNMSVNDKTVKDYSIEKGYVQVLRDWKTGDSIVLNMDMPIEKVHSQKDVKENIGKTAIQRGPLIYCIEECDNYDYGSIKVGETKFIYDYDSDMLGGIVKLKAYDSINNHIFTMIPYYSWDNRASGKMDVWIDEIKSNPLYSL